MADPALLDAGEEPGESEPPDPPGLDLRLALRNCH